MPVDRFSAGCARPAETRNGGTREREAGAHPLWPEATSYVLVPEKCCTAALGCSCVCMTEQTAVSHCPATNNSLAHAGIVTSRGMGAMMQAERQKSLCARSTASTGEQPLEAVLAADTQRSSQPCNVRSFANKGFACGVPPCAPEVGAGGA